METKKLSNEEVAREQKHIEEIDLQILTLKKTNAEIVTDPAAYESELRAKIFSHKTQIKSLEFDLHEDYSYRLAMEKISKNNEAITRHENNKKVHQKHIAEGVLVSENTDRIPEINHNLR